MVKRRGPQHAGSLFIPMSVGARVNLLSQCDVVYAMCAPTPPHFATSQSWRSNADWWQTRAAQISTNVGMPPKFGPLSRGRMPAPD